MATCVSADEIVWSPYQQAVYDAVENSRESLIVEAVAGSGKTATLVECARRLSDWDNCAAVCFNTRIKDELIKRLPAFCPALTLNALGFRAWKAFTGKSVEVDAHKVSQIIRELADDQNLDFRKGVKRLVDLAKMAGIAPEADGIVPLRQDTDAEWEGLIDEYNVSFGWGDKVSRAIDLGRKVLKESISRSSRIIDFNDQLYLPVIFNADFPKYDILFVDEAQDVSEIQRVMIERSVTAKGRVIAFGDGSQALYHFRGAGQNSLPKLKERFGARSLPLSISYRCSKAVIRKAQQFVPGIEAWEGAVEGKVDENAVWTPESFITTDVILCRNNAPLVKLAFQLLRAGKACKVLGRDIGSGLIGLVQRWKVSTVRELAERLNTYLANEIKKVQDRPDQVSALIDRVDTLRVFLENAATPDDFIRKIESLFSDETGQYLTLSTVHKFKGSEAPRVWLLNPELIGQRGWDQAEKNIMYVACTRSKIDLFFIRS